jgi:hypothetical protein
VRAACCKLAARDGLASPGQVHMGYRVPCVEFPVPVSSPCAPSRPLPARTHAHTRVGALSHTRGHRTNHGVVDWLGFRGLGRVWCTTIYYRTCHFRQSRAVFISKNHWPFDLWLASPCVYPWPCPLLQMCTSPSQLCLPHMVTVDTKRATTSPYRSAWRRRKRKKH